MHLIELHKYIINLLIKIQSGNNFKIYFFIYYNTQSTNFFFKSQIFSTYIESHSTLWIPLLCWILLSLLSTPYFSVYSPVLYPSLNPAWILPSPSESSPHHLTWKDFHWQRTTSETRVLPGSRNLAGYFEEVQIFKVWVQGYH